MAAARINEIAKQLLDASPLCAIATVGRNSRAHVNTAYFAWSSDLDLVWLSEPRARHSVNIRANDSVAVAVYNSQQSWGKPDRGIQLFGAAREAADTDADDAETVYAERFPAYRKADLSAYRFYLFRPGRLKIFDERALGAGVFVTARLSAEGRPTWERTEIYSSA